MSMNISDKSSDSQESIEFFPHLEKFFAILSF